MAALARAPDRPSGGTGGPYHEPGEHPDDHPRGTEHRLEEHRVELRGVLLPDARLTRRLRGRHPGDLHRAWRASTDSSANPRCGPGCTGSPPTCAWTCSRKACSDEPGRWISVLARRLRRRGTCTHARKPPGPTPSPTANSPPAAGDPADIANSLTLYPSAFHRRPATPPAPATRCADPGPKVLESEARTKTAALLDSCSLVNSALARAPGHPLSTRAS